MAHTDFEKITPEELEKVIYPGEWASVLGAMVRAVRNRLAHELVQRVEEEGGAAVAKYSIAPNMETAGGIAADARKLTEGIYVPSWYLPRNFFFSGHDVGDLWFATCNRRNHPLRLSRFIRGEMTDEEKVAALLNNPEWRETAKEFGVFCLRGIPRSLEERPGATSYFFRRIKSFDVKTASQELAEHYLTTLDP